MPFVARAPGKLVVIGEYAVLAGGRALVAAIDRHCVATIERTEAGPCELTTRAPAAELHRFDPAERSGVPLVDLVLQAYPQAATGAWTAALDSTAFFHRGLKLGIGSSAAAICAFAGAWVAYSAGRADAASSLTVSELIGLHRRLQGGGSGLDIAAAVTGGLIAYRAGPGSEPDLGSVQMPNSVGFAGVFAGKSALTADFVAKFEAWRRQRRLDSAAQLERMRQIADSGCTAIESGDVSAFIAAVADYGRQLEQLGEKIGGDIVTAEHRQIAALASRYGVVYKVSGAGGGDVGLAVGADSIALEDFERAVRANNYVCVELALDDDGLSVEERV